MIIGLSGARRLRLARHGFSALACLLAAVALSLALPAPDTGAQTPDTASSAGLSVTLGATSRSPHADQPFAYSVRVTNQMGAAARNVILELSQPPNFSRQELAPALTTCTDNPTSPGATSCALGTMAAGEARDLYVIGRFSGSGGEAVMQASVRRAAAARAGQVLPPAATATLAVAVEDDDDGDDSDDDDNGGGRGGGGASRGTVEIPVSFEVVNRNQSDAPGPSDGETYTIRGHISGPKELLDGAKELDTAALYLHGLSYGEFFWNFRGNQRYDFADQMAKRGHVSVTIDRLGYVKSDKPQGMDDSYGAQADIANQIVDALRDGRYKTGKAKGEGGKGKGGKSPSFDKIVLAGHSAGVFVAQIAAYSFENIDGLMVFSLTDVPTGQSSVVIGEFATTALVCGLGGERSDGDSGPGGYAFFGQTDDDFQDGHFNEADGSIIKQVTKLRTRDPCGETGSVPQALAADTTGVPTIDLPVLLVFGEKDAFFPGNQNAGPGQAALYAGSSDVTLEEIPDTGHALTFERSAGQFRRIVDEWLDDHDFSAGNGSKGNADSQPSTLPSEIPGVDEVLGDDDDEPDDSEDSEDDDDSDEDDSTDDDSGTGDDLGDVLDGVEVPGL